MKKIKVYENSQCQGPVIARVRYNTLLGCDEEGCRGLSRLRDGRYAILVSWQREGDDYGYVASPEEVLSEAARYG